MRPGVLAALAGASLAVATGVSASEVRLGAWGGPNLARLEIEDLADSDHEGRTALAMGALLSWRPARAWSLELRPAYVGRGAKVRIAGGQATIEASLIEVPLLVTRDLGGGRVRPYILAGAAIGRSVSAKAVFASREQDISDDFEKTDVSLRAGAGMSLRDMSGQPFFEIEYTHGMTDVNSRSRGLGAGVGSIHNRGIQIRLGVSFGLGGK